MDDEVSPKETVRLEQFKSAMFQLLRLDLDDVLEDEIRFRQLFGFWWPESNNRRAVHDLVKAGVMTMFEVKVMHVSRAWASGKSGIEWRASPWIAIIGGGFLGLMLGATILVAMALLHYHLAPMRLAYGALLLATFGMTALSCGVTFIAPWFIQKRIVSSLTGHASAANVIPMKRSGTDTRV